MVVLLCAAFALAGFVAFAEPADSRADVAAARARAATPFVRDGEGLATSTKEYLARVWAAARASDDPECSLDALAYEQALSLLPDRAPAPEVFFALQLNRPSCNVPPPPGPAELPPVLLPWTAAQLATGCSVPPFFVNATGGSDSNPGTKVAPFATFSRALAATRAARVTGTACIVLSGGVHYLGATQVLGAADSGLVVTGTAGDLPAWISGGAPLSDLAWAPHNVDGGANVWAAPVPASGPDGFPGLNTITPLARMRRAQYPNFDLEAAGPGAHWLDSSTATIAEWVKPAQFPLPTQVYLGQVKDDSTQNGYNYWGVGVGGPCGLWQGADKGGERHSYWCSNISDGGGAFMDQVRAAEAQGGGIGLRGPGASALLVGRCV